MKSRYVQLLLGFGISVALVASLLRIVDLGAVVTAIGLADIRLIPLAIATYLIAMLIRSLVWRRLLPVTLTVSTFALLQMVLVGFAVSYVMPLRVGEIARAFMLRNRAGVNYGTVIASLVAERVLDGVAVTGILLLSLLFLPAGRFALALGGVLGVIFVAAFGVLMVAAMQPERASRLVHLVARLSPVQRTKIDRLGQNFVHALEPLRDWRRMAWLLVLVTMGWLCQFAVFYLLMLAFNLSGGFPMAMLGGSVANFATLLPSAPGFVGTFDAALIKLFVEIQNTNLNAAAAYALVVHAVLVVPVVVLGAFILWRADLSLGQVLGGARRPAVANAETVPAGALGSATRAATRSVVMS